MKINSINALSQRTQNYNLKSFNKDLFPNGNIVNNIKINGYVKAIRRFEI